MARKHYDWSNPPELEVHSKIKHDILRDYIVEYIKIYAKNPSVGVLQMYFIDGFSGGGKYWYQTTKNIIGGSPFVMLEACLEGEALINRERSKNKFELHGEFFFIDKDKHANSGLKHNIENSQFNHLLNLGRIKIIQKTFNQAVENIISHIECKNKNSRALFLLDQYGYDQISVDLINKILTKLPNAEIILNFNVDSLLTYLTEKNLADFIRKTKFSLNHLQGQVERLWIHGDETHRRQILQKYIYDAVTRDCGAAYYESFFIKNPHGYGMYWLIHMSRRPTARHVMNAIGWQYGNDVVQYAGEGLDRFNMLGYSPRHDERIVAGELEVFAFGPSYHQLTLERLAEQVPRMAHDLHKYGAPVQTFVNETCNHTGASKQQYLEILTSLHAGHEITLYDQNNKPLRRGSRAKESHSIVAIPQSKLFI